MPPAAPSHPPHKFSMLPPNTRTIASQSPPLPESEHTNGHPFGLARPPPAASWPVCPEPVASRLFIESPLHYHTPDATFTAVHTTRRLFPREFPPALQPTPIPDNVSYLFGGVGLSIVLGIVAASMGIVMWRKRRPVLSAAVIERKQHTDIRADDVRRQQHASSRPGSFVQDPKFLAVPETEAFTRSLPTPTPVARRPPSPLRLVTSSTTSSELSSAAASPRTPPPLSSPPPPLSSLPFYHIPDSMHTPSCTNALVAMPLRSFEAGPHAARVIISPPISASHVVYETFRPPLTYSTHTGRVPAWDITQSTSSISSVVSSCSSATESGAAEAHKIPTTDSEVSEAEVMSGFQIQHARIASCQRTLIAARQRSIDGIILPVLQPVKAALVVDSGRVTRTNTPIEVGMPLTPTSSKSLNLNDFPPPPLFTLPGVLRS